MDNASAAPAAVHTVSLKLPTFWTERPAVWFAQAEAQFLVKGITVDATKHAHVIGALGNEAAAEVEAHILHPPNNNKYDGLKASLIDAFGLSQMEKDIALLSLGGLGDRKPTSLLRYMESLNADPATLFKACFLQQLPADVRRILASSNKTVQDLAKDADRIMEATGKELSAISAMRQPAESPATDSSLCFFHARFGRKARNCKGDGCKMANQKLAQPAIQGNSTAGR